MIYRIRYCDAHGVHQQEVLIEAHNTTEALVKFCHAHGAGPGVSLASTRVSIWPEPAQETLVGPEAAPRR